MSHIQVFFKGTQKEIAKNESVLRNLGTPFLLSLFPHFSLFHTHLSGQWKTTGIKKRSEVHLSKEKEKNKTEN